MNITAAREGVMIALDALRSNKVRAFLTILGIVIGVITVVTMAAAIGGFRSSVMEMFSAIGPNNFIVDRFDNTQLQMSDGSDRPPWEGKPPLTFQEAALISNLPSVKTVAVAVNAGGTMRAGSKSVSGVQIMGRSAEWTDYSLGDFQQGRNFLPADDARSAGVVVLSYDLADQLFPSGSAVGKMVRVGQEQFEVVGVYKMKENVFSAAQTNWAVVPPTTAIKRVGANPDWMALLVVPEDGVAQQKAIDDVTVTLRASRGLRPGEQENFAVVKQQAMADMFNKLTGVFFIVLTILSSIGLLVGGVGVVGIMMISVTERTREIGVRKALGATRREILWQFLVESMTVTVIGGAIGLAIATFLSWLVKQYTPIPAAVPLWAVVASLMMAAIGGIAFGLYPANKAARLDPVEALRYE